jgi:hypothetical protein
MYERAMSSASARVIRGRSVGAGGNKIHSFLTTTPFEGSTFGTWVTGVGLGLGGLLIMKLNSLSTHGNEYAAINDPFDA